MPVPAGDLLADTTASADPAVPGRYHGFIPAAWQVMNAFGGVTMTAALRAMQTALARPDLQLTTANAIFVAPVPCGPVEIDVTVLRNGRTAAQVAADLRVPGGKTVALRTHGVFGVAHDTALEFQGMRFPEVPPPSECSPPPVEPMDDNGPWGHINFHDQTDWLPVTQNGPWSPDFRRGDGRFCVWTRLLKPPRLGDGTYDLLSLALQGDVLGPAVGQAIGPVDARYMVLSLEIGIRFIATPATDWILQEIEAWHVGDGYATGPARLWDQHGRLLAIATQTANLRVFDR